MLNNHPGESDAQHSASHTNPLEETRQRTYHSGLAKSADTADDSKKRKAQSAVMESYEDRPTRTAGRPRLHASGTADRRQQIRRTQKTYRLKKEAATQSTQLRVAELEQHISKINDSFDKLYNTAIEVGLNATRPMPLTYLDEMQSVLKSPARSVSQESPVQSSVRRVNPEKCASQEPNNTQCGRETESPLNLAFGYQVPACPSYRNTDIGLPMRSIAHYTYSFHEATFPRSLQRYCLEYAFRLFTDPRSHPTEIYRVFSLPSYCNGGAGTHYPALDGLGNPIYPHKMRLPRRVLGLLPMTDLDDDARPGCEPERYLEIFGLGGQWFDCQDVEGADKVGMVRPPTEPLESGEGARSHISTTANHTESGFAARDSILLCSIRKIVQYLPVQIKSPTTVSTLEASSKNYSVESSS
ncbi:hypothetical protein AJ80_01145 [Polytolypa hystricis UAMH7299]|uniref:BZIP domain-containing protein n=1 Tax=Polytolypa hystricis (strain UAMH7299) TaxID=1447883 RepID=A0A2B7Z232_POLH7|nr:hypothetical protein AJ80_01145 [Polytolypa hystricis UAMH7299]